MKLLGSLFMHLNRHLLTATLVLTASFVMVISAPGAMAASSPLGVSLIPDGCIGRQGATDAKCGLPEMVQIAINLSRILLATLGSVTLLIVVYGGFIWLTSAGSSERIQKGRKIFEGALIGFVIVIGSWVIINFVIAALTGQSPAEQIQLFKGNNQKPAFQLPTTTSP